MKRFLNKKLSVKQIFTLIILPLGIAASVFVFSNGAKPELIPKLVRKIKDTIAPQLIIKIDTSALGQLNTYVDSINNAPELFAGSWSFYLVEVDSAKVISKNNIDKGLVPASVMKVITTGTALSLLGNDYRFPTRLEYDGTIDLKTKTLNGNIYIRGSGDPSLGSESFGSSINSIMNDWATAIKKKGIDSINGSIIGDAECFDRDPIPNGWTWGDIQCDYGAGTCGLNIHENVFDIIFAASKERVTIKTSPFIYGLKLHNQVVFNPTIAKSYAYVQGAPFQFERTVFGEVQKFHKERAAIPDPALFCAQSLNNTLAFYDIYVRDSSSTVRIIKLNNVKKNAKKERKLISTIYSPSLGKLIYHTNQISQNFYAESILRSISLNESGYGSSYSSVNTIYKYWKDRQVDVRGMCMVDGSGLSRMNTITTHQLVDMLCVLAKDSVVFPSFYQSLPVAGKSGTLRKLADSIMAEGNLHAKSGTMARVKSYAGYLKTKSGKLLCFAMIANNTLWSDMELKHKFEKLFILMANLP